MSGPAAGLRVGLTGGLGSGKSTVAALLATRGAHVLSADELGRSLMHPGSSVFADIVSWFGPGVLQPDGELDRAALARIAFVEGRVEELNAIVHPATIALQAREMEKIFARQPHAIVVVESALIFETLHGETHPGETLDARDWRRRFDRLVLVTAPEALKVARFVTRSGGGNVAAGGNNIATLEAEARRRLARMIPDEQKLAQCDFVIRNEGTVAELERQVDSLWSELRAASKGAASRATL